MMQKRKGSPILFPSIGPGAASGVQAVSPQPSTRRQAAITFRLACGYLPMQPKSVTAHRQVPNYIAW